ncbi:MAG: hypothetical protein R3F59_15025 [Myxococcota bacterium]
MKLDDLNSSLESACLDFLGGAPLVYHCHHFNLFLDQTVDDAVGSARGWELRRDMAHQAWLQLLSAVADGVGAHTPAERLTACQQLYAAMGHGRMAVTADRGRGAAEGEFLHYGFAWKQKYGAQVRRHRPVDAVAAGFAAAATQVAHRTAEPLVAVETGCIAKEDPRCTFEIAPGGPPPGRVVHESDLRPVEPRTGLAEERISAINAGLRNFLGGVAGDDRGLVEAFGVFVTRHMTNYYNGISYGAVDVVRERSEALVPMVEGLLRESGHVCVFNTFGGILYSPEWDALVGRIEGDLTEVVSSCCAIARALGFGAWTIEELSPKRLVVTTSTEYESPWCATVRTEPCPGASYFLQGAAVAFMRLALDLDWKARRPLTRELYDDLFKGDSRWRVEQPDSLAAGSAVSRVVVESR